MTERAHRIGEDAQDAVRHIGVSAWQPACDRIADCAAHVAQCWRRPWHDLLDYVLPEDLKLQLDRRLRAAIEANESIDALRIDALDVDEHRRRQTNIDEWLQSFLDHEFNLRQGRALLRLRTGDLLSMQ